MSSPVRLHKIDDTPAMSKIETFILNHWQFFLILSIIVLSTLVIALAFVMAGANATGTEANIYYEMEKVI